MRRLLIVGCGDIGFRLAQTVRGRWRVYALSRSARHHESLRALGAVPVVADLDRPETLGRLAGLANDVVHLVPPPRTGTRDTRTSNLVRALAKGGSIPQRLVYMSTSGVYGDCRGALVPETRPTMPMSPRARRRRDAERLLRCWGAERGTHVTVLRVPGIYAAERLPLARLRSGTPALESEQDAYTNHIHADDLARIVLAALVRGKSGRTYNASDDSSMKMGDYFDLVADRFGLPHPPRVSWEAAQSRVPETVLSFMRESRRLSNVRLKKELRVRLQYPSVHEGVAAARAS
ncbi:MAG: NAD-dependent epimerase/dehydratase family protein [Betaproteobacteria bacterium]|nr:MAG: NAD-dependent epimerase/dehydratase family protein [Betaproteobacteria bacterium]